MSQTMHSKESEASAYDQMAKRKGPRPSVAGRDPVVAAAGAR
jgi:hypothetical protein